MLRLGLGALGAAALLGLASVGLAAVIDRASVVDASGTQTAQIPEERRMSDHASCRPNDQPMAHRLFLLVQSGELSTGLSRWHCPNTFDLVHGNRQLRHSMDCSVEFEFSSLTEGDRPDWVLEHNHNAVVAGDVPVDGLAQVSALSCVQALEAQEKERLKDALETCMARRIAPSEDGMTAHLSILRDYNQPRYCGELRPPAPDIRLPVTNDDPVF